MSHKNDIQSVYVHSFRDIVIQCVTSGRNPSHFINYTGKLSNKATFFEYDNLLQ